jgi:hypothetical protein
MFAGVTASSMPAVRQFFSRQDRLVSWGSSLKRTFIGASSRKSSNAESSQLGGHVATLRPYESGTEKKTAAEHGVAQGDEDLEAARIDSHAHVSRDSASTLGKDDASFSFKSISVGSW